MATSDPAGPSAGSEHRPHGQPRQRYFVWFLGAACAALAVLVVMLARQNHALKTRLAEAAQYRATTGTHRAAPRADGMSIDDHLTSLMTFAAYPTSGAGGTPAAAPLEVRFAASQATLLFIFGGGCDACNDMEAPVARLAQAAGGVGAVVVGLQIDAAGPGDFKHTGLGFPVCGVSERKGTWLERVVTVPGLALVDSQGTVKRLWWGVIDDAQELEARQAMEHLALGRGG